jgi:hypothetical protein
MTPSANYVNFHEFMSLGGDLRQLVKFADKIALNTRLSTASAS